jgi:hypothetical protein
MKDEMQTNLDKVTRFDDRYLVTLRARLHGSEQGVGIRQAGGAGFIQLPQLIGRERPIRSAQIIF